MRAKEKMGISKMVIVAVVAAILIIAAIVGAYYFFREAPTGFRISVDGGVTKQDVEETGGYVELGEDVTVNGYEAPGSAEVTLTYTMPDSNLSRLLLGLELIRPTFTRRLTADGNGKFTDTFSPNVTGRWDVTASAEEETTDPETFYIFKSPPIKIGVIGPMEWIQGVGMREAAIMAAEEVNDVGGFLGRKVVIRTGDEGDVPERGTAEMERLCSVEEVQFVMGGFRTEITDPMREKAMDYRIIYSILGSATPWLIDCRTSPRWPCDRCIREDYDRYKYLFRVMPPNTDVLFSGYLVPYLKEHLIPNVIQPALVEAGKLAPDAGGPGVPEKVRVAIVIEALDWTKLLRDTLDEVGPTVFFGGHAEIVSLVGGWPAPGGHVFYGVSPLTKDFTPILQEIKDKGTHVIFECFSGEEGLTFLKQWKDLEVPAVPVGINVLSQESEMWDWTGGRCEYEAFLGTMGTRTPVVPGVTDKFWDDYTSRWGHSPIYTSFGAYEAVRGTAVIIEQAASDDPELRDPATWETLYKDRWEEDKIDLYDILIPYMEKMDRRGILGRTNFTASHDVFVPGWDAIDRGLEDFVKPLVIQWRAGEMVPVSAGRGSHQARAYPPYYDGSTAPDWAPYIKEFKLPPSMLE